jgi:hypothetical protein
VLVVAVAVLLLLIIMLLLLATSSHLLPCIPASLDSSVAQPRVLFKCGKALDSRKNGPLTLTAIVLSKSSSAAACVAPSLQTPVATTKPFSLPCFSTAAVIAAPHAAAQCQSASALNRYCYQPRAPPSVVRSAMNSLAKPCKALQFPI